MSALALPTVSRELVTDAPPPLLSAYACTGQMPRDWFLVHCQSHREKSLAWAMVEHELPYYLPLTLLIRRRGRVEQRHVVPLFDGYMFGNGDACREFCARSRHVISIIPVPMSGQAKLAAELSSVEIAIHANPSLEVCDVTDVGQRVRVVSGPMEGMEGHVESFQKHCRVIVSIGMMGRGVPMDVDRDDLEVVSTIRQ